MDCSNCLNFEKNKIIPGKKPLCVKCYNLKAYGKGEEYICNYCEMTCLRVQNFNICVSCDNLLNKTIYKINKKVEKDKLKLRRNYYNVLDEFKCNRFKKNIYNLMYNDSDYKGEKDLQRYYRYMNIKGYDTDRLNEEGYIEMDKFIVG